MIAIQYVLSVPRYLASRAGGRVWGGIYTSRASTARIVDIKPPKLPGARWARVRPILSGICGSDLATITAKGSTYFSPFTSTPFVFGHEVVGEVTDIGPGVSAVHKGDRVVLSPPLHCAVRGIEDLCGACRAGQTGHCTQVTAGDLSAGIQTGYCRDTGGGWSEEFVAHELQLYRVSDRIPDEAAVLIEPLSCCLHAVQVGAPEDDHTVLVLGGGTIGVLTIAALRAIGSRSRVVAVARYPYQQRLAGEVGADEVVPTDKGMRSRLAEILGASLHQPELGPPVALGGADVTFDCVGSNRTLDDSLRFTRARGQAIVVGMPGLARGIDWTAMWHKELDVRGSYTCDEPTFRRAIDVADRIQDRLVPLVGVRFPLVEYRKAIRRALSAGRSGVTKVAFHP